MFPSNLHDRLQGPAGGTQRSGSANVRWGTLHLITIKTFRDPWDAHLFRTRLEADGVKAFVADDQVIWMDWPLSTALGGVRVQVPNGSGEAAEATRARCASGEYQAELAEMFGDIEELLCPHCGSRDIGRRPSVFDLVFGVAMLFFTAVKVDPDRCRCRVCGTRWIDERYA